MDLRPLLDKASELTPAELAKRKKKKLTPQQLVARKKSEVIETSSYCMKSRRDWLLRNIVNSNGDRIYCMTAMAEHLGVSANTLYSVLKEAKLTSAHRSAEDETTAVYEQAHQGSGARGPPVDC